MDKKELEYITGYKDVNNALIVLFLMSKYPEYFHHLFIEYEKQMFRNVLRLRSIWENQKNEKINRLKNLIYEKQQILSLKDILK